MYLCSVAEHLEGCTKSYNMFIPKIIHNVRFRACTYVCIASQLIQGIFLTNSSNLSCLIRNDFNPSVVMLVASEYHTANRL